MYLISHHIILAKLFTMLPPHPYRVRMRVKMPAANEMHANVISNLHYQCFNLHPNLIHNTIQVRFSLQLYNTNLSIFIKNYHTTKQNFR